MTRCLHLFFITTIFVFNLVSRDYPLAYLKSALSKFKENNGKIIVEIGSMRGSIKHPIDEITCNYCLEGHSTYFWGDQLKRSKLNKAKVFSVDIDPENTKIARVSCAQFKQVRAITQDGIKFLKSFRRPIDLLFLDAWDVGTKNYAEKHLEAYNAAKPRLHSKSLILIDDTDIDNGGKGRLIVPQAIKDGYKVIFSGRQTLLGK